VRLDLLAVLSSGSIDSRATGQDHARPDRTLAEKLRDEAGSGLTHFRAGRSEEAAAHFTRAAALAPRDANIHHALGSALGKLKRADEALACFARAIALAPHEPRFHYALGVELSELSRLSEAEACFRRALAAQPDFVDASVHLGYVLRSQDRFEEAASCFLSATTQCPDRADAYNALGAVLIDLRRYAEAELAIRRALDISRDYPQALTNLGVALAARDQFEEAEALHRRALAHGEFADAWLNLGLVLHETGRLSEAVACYRRAIAIAPDHSNAHLCLSITLLTQGDIPAGSAAYEARWGARAKCKYPLADRPLWDGTPMPGKTLLLVGEQGRGDAIQFARYAKLVRPRVGRLLLRCRPALRDLLATQPNFDAVVSEDEPIPQSDAFLPIMSLMHVLGTTLDTIPAEVPYLHADPMRVRRFAARLTGDHLKIGIVWAGIAGHTNDRHRSMSLATLTPLLDVSGAHFVSLQVAPRAAELRESAFAEKVIDLAPDLVDFADTAAALSQLDLLISVDTAVAHLAGALGLPAWVLLPFNADWRWLRDRDDSPWYPTLRLYRQDASFAWAPVIERVRGDLLKHVGERVFGRK
jgi:Flp pilus assembly protein TadD